MYKTDKYIALEKGQQKSFKIECDENNRKILKELKQKKIPVEKALL